MTRHGFATRLMGAVTLALLTLGGPQGSAQEAASDFTPEKVLAKYGPAVVSISGKTKDGSAYGSGFLVSADGQIVTNYHVVRGLYPAQVKLANGDVYDDISVISYDARRDLAILKIKGFNLPVVELGNSDEVKLGTRVVVLGNPIGMENTVSDGLLSGPRDLGTGSKVYQMSAPISPGSSGGPVFDHGGRVIGVTVSSAVEGQNLNFCVPINYARGMMGGPVQFSLKDLPEEKLAGDAAESSSGPSSGVETLKLLIEAVTDYCRGWDCVSVGMGQSQPVYRSGAGDSYPPYVDSDVNRAAEFFRQAVEKAARAADGRGEAADLALRYYISFRKIAAAHSARVDLLFSPGGSYEAEDERYRTTYTFACKEVTGLNAELVKLVQAQAPELHAALPPGTLPLDLPPIKPGDGQIGVFFAMGSPEPRVVAVERNSPAWEGGVKAGDVVLGVVGGPDFTTQEEVVRYLRSHPKEKVTVRVRRGNKERRCVVVPKPYKP